MPRVRHTSCLVPGCGREPRVFGYCQLHHRRIQRGTDIERPLEGATPAREVFEYYMAKARTLPVSGCVVWKGNLDRSGYPYFSAEGKRYFAHRYAWELANGRDVGDAFVCHMCDTPACVNPKHLELGDPAENALDAAVRGRLAAKLTPAKVRFIRKVMSGQRPTQAELAEALGVSQPLISNVLRGNVWAHVVDDHKP